MSVSESNREFRIYFKVYESDTLYSNSTEWSSASDLTTLYEIGNYAEGDIPNPTTLSVTKTYIYVEASGAYVLLGGTIDGITMSSVTGITIRGTISADSTMSITVNYDD